MRTFQCAFAVASFLLALFAPAVARCTDAAKIDPRPSILFAIADDWSYPHAGAYGDKVVNTPTFDRIAAEGMLFTRAFCAAPTCSASRASILTGQWPHRLAEGANLWGTLPARFPVYPDLLEKAGYHVGFTRKGWGPGALGDRKRNPAGNFYQNFDEFIKTVPPGEPFCFWFGSHDPHRAYVRDSGAKSGMKIADVTVPPYLPDTPETRGDILDYYFAVERYDRDTGNIVKKLESAGRLDNTIVVMTSDNGWPFPRAKANVYEWSAHMPLAIRWPARIKGGRKNNDLVSLIDMAPTFLQAAGVDARQMPDMNGQSLLGALIGDASIAVAPRTAVYFERERHANVRAGDLGYPMRAIRTDKYLYVQNLRPDLWPAGDPKMWKTVGPFGDIDPGPTKSLILDRRNDPAIAEFFRLACAKRLGEEMFDLQKDPSAMHDVAGVTEYQKTQQKLATELHAWMKQTADPRADKGGAYDAFDRYPYAPADPKPTLPASKPAGK
ncbi:MAG TPA: sulfatase [Tepidisphaeraceae bacterium]|jgi:arylsulfatase A-like enzyme|nr:sulfatase [Tepidisphaeraceae bacterium]